MNFIKRNPVYSALIAVELVLLAVAIVYWITGLIELSHYYPLIHLDWSPYVS